MIYYLLHQSPIFNNLSNGKRNVRILFIAMTIYIFLHVFTRENKNNNYLCKIFQGCLPYFIIGDIFLAGVMYKLYYGRSLLNELDLREKDYYDTKTHRYYDKDIKSRNSFNVDNYLTSNNNDNASNHSTNSTHHTPCSPIKIPAADVYFPQNSNINDKESINNNLEDIKDVNSNYTQHDENIDYDKHVESLNEKQIIIEEPKI